MLIFFVFTFKVNAASFDFYKVKYKCPVRTNPSEKASIIKNGNDDVYVYPNNELEYIKTELGLNNGMQNQQWYAVKFDYAAREYTGYVAKACMYEKVTKSYSDDNSFEEQIKNFPESYKLYLRRLHALHPNWKFVIDNTNLDFKSSVQAESKIGQSAISHLYPSLIYKDSSNPNGIIVDGSSWYAPCYDAVAYYFDPRNFLQEKYIFMFQSLVYNSDQDKNVSDILKGSFMDSSFSEDGYTKTYTDAFIEAAKKTGVSSIHLASRALQEMGTTMSAAASGTVSGYEGYYNFYNIGAYSGENNYILGLQRAVKDGWNSRQKAITGGAQFIFDSYVNKGKDTLYFQKFNVSTRSRVYQSPYTYEYMANIMAPSSEASNIYSSYNNNKTLDIAYTFTIPVYNNMPSSAYKVSRTDTVTEEVPKQEESSNNTSLSADSKVNNAGYQISNGYLSKITLGTDMTTLRSKITNAGAVVATLNSSWNSKVSGKIATGDIIEVDNNKRYQVVIYGDIVGDGNISVLDLLYLKKHITNDINLSDASKLAADISKDGNANVVDLLLLKKYLLNEYTINQ